jgi:hypothetical protein
MPVINLIPLERRIRRARRIAVSRWVGASVLVVIGAMAPAGALALTASPERADVGDRMARSERAVAQFRAEEPRLRAELADLTRTDALLRAVADRPDWRPLLHAIASASGDARFERVEAGIPAENTQEVRVRLLALVESQTEARAFVLRLESLGLFDEVKLAGTGPVPLANREVIRCEISARFRLGGPR